MESIEDKIKCKDLVKDKIIVINVGLSGRVYDGIITRSEIGCSKNEITIYIDIPRVEERYSFISDNASYNKIITDQSINLDEVIENETVSMGIQ